METFHVRVGTLGGVISTRPWWVKPYEPSGYVTSTNSLGINPLFWGGINDPRPEAMALLGLYNRVGSGKVLRIKEIEINSIPPIKGVTICKLILQRITEATGGLSSSTISELDSNNAALTGLECLTNSIVTLTGDPLWQVQMRASDAWTWSYAASATYLYGLANPTAGFRGFDKSQDSKVGVPNVYVWKPNTAVQRIILRDGEGIALHMNNLAYLNLEYSISVWVRNSATGACYCLNMITVSAENALFSLMNSSGASVYEILRLEICEQGPCLGPLFTVEDIEGLDLTKGGTAVTPIPMDSNNSLSANIVCGKNCYVQMLGFADGVLVPASSIKTWTNVKGPGVGTEVVMGPLQLKNVIWTSRNNQDYVLREGRGLAVINRGWANNADCDIIVRFTQELGVPTDAEIAQAVWEYGERTLTG